MVIYVEGIDRAGKTTFINEFSTYLAIPSYRKEPPTSLEATEYHSYFKGIGYALIEFYKLIECDLIIDRSFISDWIYTNRYGDVVDISVWREWEERHLQQNVDVIVFYFEIDKPTFSQRIKSQEDPYMNTDDFVRYTTLYNQYLSSTIFKYVRLSGILPFDKQLDAVISALKNFKYRSKSSSLNSLLQ